MTTYDRNIVRSALRGTGMRIVSARRLERRERKIINRELPMCGVMIECSNQKAIEFHTR